MEWHPLAMMFMCWKVVVREKVIEYLHRENERLTRKLGTIAKSIWTQRKPDLVRLATQELGLSTEAAEKLTVGQLRFRLREQREMEEVTSPQSGLPKGLNSLRHAELANECQNRGIEIINPTRRSGFKVREEMIRDIMEYEERATAEREPNLQAGGSAPERGSRGGRPTPKPSVKARGKPSGGYSSVPNPADMAVDSDDSEEITVLTPRTLENARQQLMAQAKAKGAPRPPI